MLSNTRFKLYGPVPRSLRESTTHIITCRGTILGIHTDEHPPQPKEHKRTRKRALEVPPFPKTTLLAFNHLKHASYVKGELKASGFEHYPLTIETIQLSDIEKLCMLQFFNLHLVYNVLKAPNNCLHADCYTFVTSEPPNRQFLNFYFENLFSS